MWLSVVFKRLRQLCQSLTMLIILWSLVFIIQCTIGNHCGEGAQKVGRGNEWVWPYMWGAVEALSTRNLPTWVLHMWDVVLCSLLTYLLIVFQNPYTEFYILLSLHLDVIMVNDQLDALFFNVFISRLYMFRGTSAHHQEDQLVSMCQYIIWYNTLWWVTVWCAGQECVMPDDVLTQVGPPDDEQLLLETCRGVK
jgi:hypothetical protein